MPRSAKKNLDCGKEEVSRSGRLSLQEKRIKELEEELAQGKQQTIQLLGVIEGNLKPTSKDK